MIDFLIKSPFIFFLFAAAMMFVMYQIRKLNELSE